MTTPVTSTIVATKGAEEVAGSKPAFLRIRGKTAPDKVPHKTTPINDKPIVVAIMIQCSP